MEMFTTAIGNVFNPMCLFLIWGGTMLGIIFGSIPGLSATMAVVLFLPLTFGMEPTMGLALLVGLYMGGISGGLISAILLKIPGTPSSISTVFDGGPMAEFITQIPNFIISSVIGIVIGILPGIGGSTGGLLAYTAEKSRSKYPEKFGTGIIDGVIASESANNAVIGGSMVPLLCMGIPGNTVAAIFLGGLLVHGISPGPLIFQNSGEYVYGIYLALIVSTVFMVIFERLGLPIFTKLLDIPKHILLPIIMVMCCVGAFSSDSRAFDVMCVLAFAMVGLLFKTFKLPSTPLIIGFILGPMFEENLRRALMASHGDWTTFVTHPISCVFLLVAVVFCTITVRKNLKEKKAAEAKGETFDTAEEEG